MHTGFQKMCTKNEFCVFNNVCILFLIWGIKCGGGRCGCNCMVVGFTTTCAISAYYHYFVILLFRTPFMVKCTR